MSNPDPHQPPPDGSSHCNRCKAAFPAAELRPIPKILLNILAAIHLLPGSEADQRYCPSCHDSMRSCAFFLAVVGVAGMALMISKAWGEIFG